MSRAFEDVPRHLFFPAGIDPQTPDDQPVLLAEGRLIPPVDVVRMMLRALDLEGTERVLEIGGGSGYQAALLGRLAREVVSLEVDGAYAGWPEAAPYQAIVVGAAAPELPTALIDQLDLGGRLVIPLGDADAQLVERFQKRPDSLDSQTIGACRLLLLPTLHEMPSSFPWTGHRQR